MITSVERLSFIMQRMEFLKACIETAEEELLVGSWKIESDTSYLVGRYKPKIYSKNNYFPDQVLEREAMTYAIKNDASRKAREKIYEYIKKLDDELDQLKIEYAVLISLPSKESRLRVIQKQ